jgi:hypothetical protein
MIDIKKALNQRCYIKFDSNQQLCKFLTDNNLTTFLGIADNETIISVHLDNDLISLAKKVDHGIPTYHHTELTITDDGE